MIPDYAQLVQDKIVLRRAAAMVLDAADARAPARDLLAALVRLRAAMDETNDERRKAAQDAQLEPLTSDEVVAARLALDGLDD